MQGKKEYICVAFISMDKLTNQIISVVNYIHWQILNKHCVYKVPFPFKIADFGMSRDLLYESYYVSHGGLIPVKWTAPEVPLMLSHTLVIICWVCIAGSTLQEVLHSQ